MKEEIGITYFLWRSSPRDPTEAFVSAASWAAAAAQRQCVSRREVNGLCSWVSNNSVAGSGEGDPYPLPRSYGPTSPAHIALNRVWLRICLAGGGGGFVRVLARQLLAGPHHAMLPPQ